MSGKITSLNKNGKKLSIANSDFLTEDKNVVYLDTVEQATQYVGNDGDVVHISDKDRGGVFVYDSTATDDGGVVFGKCVRQYEGAVNVKWFNDDIVKASETAILNNIYVVSTIRHKVYTVDEPIELSNSSTDKRRRSLSIIGGGVIKPSNTFTGNQVIQHTQTTSQASFLSFGHGVNLDIEIDGSLLPAGTIHGMRLDGTWQASLKVNIHNMTGHGWYVPADNSIDNTGDDSYGNITPVLTSCKFTGNNGWGIYASRFASPFIANSCYVNDNKSGGVRICSPNVVWTQGAISYNKGGGLLFTQAESAITSQLSTCRFFSCEFDSNENYNIHFEHAYLCEIIQPRLISREDNGVMIPSTMVKFGGTAGKTAFGNRVYKSYMRHSQQTTNPPITFFDFNLSSTFNNCEKYRELADGSSNLTIADTSGSGINNDVSNYTGEVIYTYRDKSNYRTGYVEARKTTASSISTVLEDLIFNSKVSDVLNRYDTSDGSYDVSEQGGVVDISGYITTVAPTTNALIYIYLFVDNGGGYVSYKIIRKTVIADLGDQAIDFLFKVLLNPGTKIKLQATASTGQTLSTDARDSRLSINIS